jgi:hypothetical protein
LIFSVEEQIVHLRTRQGRDQLGGLITAKLDLFELVRPADQRP